MYIAFIHLLPLYSHPFPFLMVYIISYIPVDLLPLPMFHLFTKVVQKVGTFSRRPLKTAVKKYVLLYAVLNFEDYIVLFFS